MTFQELLSLLPSCGGPTTFPLAAKGQNFEYQRANLKEFVAPSLEDRADVSNPAHPRVVIISAAGAVGKSTLAREIAFDKRAPLWDLSRSGPVGKHTLVGQLTTSFGPPAVTDIHSALASERLFVVIDALDEARVQVNEASFQAFIEDVGELGTAGAGCSIVLLGRTQIAETAWLLLQEAGVQAALYMIEPFEQEQAERYVELRVRALGEKGSRQLESYRQAYEAARDLIFVRLREAIGAGQGSATEKEIRSVLGYAPVLDAVATLLATEANFEALRQGLTLEQRKASTPARYRAVALLRRIVERIMEREQEEKLVRNIRPALEGLAQGQGWDAWDALYSEREQCGRLVGRILGVSSRADVQLPAALSNRYEEQVATWLPEHPFLRDGRTPANSVFESYLFARALLEDIGGCGRAAERQLRRREYKPSKLLADFYFLLKEQGGSNVMPAEHIGLVYDSMLSAETDRLHVRISIDGSDPEEVDDVVVSDADIEFELVSVPGSDREPVFQSVAFETTVTASSTITFGRYLRDASVTVPCAVGLGEGTSEFEIGPAVYVRCRRLRIEAESLSIGGKTRPRLSEDQDESVTLEADTCDSRIGKKPVAHVPFHVSWPGVNEFPWTDFQWSGRRTPGPDARIEAAYLRFRRIVLTLRSHSRGNLARYRPKVEHQRVLKGEVGEALLAALVADGILQLRGSFYYWVPVKADQLVGISWERLRRGETSATLSGYLERFVAKHQKLFR